MLKEIEEAQDVFVCRLVKEGVIDVGPIATNYYSGAEFEVQSTLRGEVSKRLVTTFLVRAFPPDKAETTPKLGEAYIVIGHTTGNSFELRKLVPATAANLQEVYKLLGKKYPDASEVGPPITPKEVSSITNTPTPNQLYPTSAIEKHERDWRLVWCVVIFGAVGMLWLAIRRGKERK